MTLASRIRYVASQMTDIDDYDVSSVGEFCFMSGIKDPAEIADLTLAIEDEIGMPRVLDSFPFSERALTIDNMIKHIRESAVPLSELVPVRVGAGCDGASSS